MDRWRAGAGRRPRAEGSGGGVVRAGKVTVPEAASSSSFLKHNTESDHHRDTPSTNC